MSRDASSASYLGDSLDKEFNLASMRAYIKKKPEMDKELERMLTPYLIDGATLFDACCGIGHIIYHLHKTHPNVSFTGVDAAPYLIEEAKKLTAGKNVHFEVADIFDLPDTYKKTFDISVCWKTLSWLPTYEDAVRSLVATTRSHIFMSALFYDGDIDYEIRVREHVKERGKSGGSTYHNIYGVPRFRDFLTSLGAKKVEFTDFEIGIDLPRGSIDHMGTYTVPLQDGGRLQMSGALPMPWKIVHIEL